MKATELMIGDWVQFHHLGIKKVSDVAPRCKSINVDYIGQIEGVYVGVNDGEGQCGIKTVPNDYEKETGHHMMHTFAIEPIPITEEVLEKNGFRLTEEFSEDDRESGYYRLEPGLSDTLISDFSSSLFQAAFRQNRSFFLCHGPLVLLS